MLDPSVSKVLYISTDEKDKSLFAPFAKQFRLRFLSDIAEKARLGAEHINQNHIGMIEQVICANAHTFIGTPYSTFTGYITRMRGEYYLGYCDLMSFVRPSLTGFLYSLRRLLSRWALCEDILYHERPHAPVR